ncbi:hypothetical protein FEM48_Zijuj01G0296100 [Ziziphus jujuba var. spinosa]|uniref:Protein SYS1 homolog n=1 Tax=Ziziphus jujuba var. spinosa TaxID=714518 RepID=A0A978W5S5_ZIZJJ|nr:hypothetical protein FEM48_Zijuj01G0296100 [Ziziphus jujuba var. spinosa]
MFYGATVWDPWLIVAQIFCLQCLYYLTLGLLLSILVGSRVSRMSLVYFFDYATVSASTVTGWCVIASFLLSSFAGAGYLLLLIERAKKCLDFAATVYIVHLFMCIVYGGWPSSITWWVVNGTGIAIMALLGEYLCIRRELREIPITRYRSRSMALIHIVVMFDGGETLGEKKLLVGLLFVVSAIARRSTQIKLVDTKFNLQ